MTVLRRPGQSLERRPDRLGGGDSRSHGIPLPRPIPTGRRRRFAAGFTLSETLIAVALLALLAGALLASQAHHSATVRRVEAVSRTLRLARSEHAALRAAPPGVGCRTLDPAARAAGYACTTSAVPCPYAAACTVLATRGVAFARVLATGPHGARTELVVPVGRGDLPAALEGR